MHYGLLVVPMVFHLLRQGLVLPLGPGGLGRHPVRQKPHSLLGRLQRLEHFPLGCGCFGRVRSYEGETGGRLRRSDSELSSLAGSPL